ncbi:MAG: CRISPR system precrRNA processing endoribonuclease RAMP protein Cas6 [Lachnospiraceae bacterium]|nr:CRISPR system precrRNA processing endoribonuclease RAMP protein Cas6 [Lachnospiraceae bacterium]
MGEFDIRYIKLHFELEMVEDTTMSVNKASAIRGGIGEMLLRANCISDRDCEKCDFESECIVQRTMYSKFDREVELVGDMNSIGYIIECDDYREDYLAGDILSFSLLLFGKTIVYFNQYLQAVYALGQNGIGKHKSRFTIKQVRNSRMQPILDGYNVNMSMYKYEVIKDYIQYRTKQVEDKGYEKKILFRTPLTLKHNGKFLEEFDANLLVKAIQRRLYILNCYEGNYDNDIYEKDLPTMNVVNQKIIKQRVDRYSNRKNSKMHLKGIRGELIIEDIPIEVLPILLAGEIIHVGKNTSFGFGHYNLR